MQTKNRQQLESMQQLYNRALHPERYAQVRGEVAASFTPLKKAFARIQPASSQRQDSLLNPKQSSAHGRGGSALVVYQHGKPVVQLYAGDANPSQPWQANTLALSFSCGKAVLATLVHILVSEGVLSYDAPIAHYWQDFAQNGKADITLRQVLSHRAGLYNIRDLIDSASFMNDWQGMCARVAAMPVDTNAQEKSVYQALTFGYIVGGLIEQATGEVLQDVLRDKLLAPLGIENDFFFGVPTGELHRVARTQSPPAKSTAKTSAKPATNPATQKNVSSATASKGQSRTTWLKHTANKLSLKKATLLGMKMINDIRGVEPQYFFKAIAPKGSKTYDYYSDVVLQACAPSFNGTFTATAMATLYAMLANGGTWQGRTFISPDVFAEATRIQDGQQKLTDQVFMSPMRWRLGYHKALTLTKRAPRAFGHSGYNASLAWCDPKSGLAFCYVHNFSGVLLGTDFRAHFLSEVALGCVYSQSINKSPQ